MLKCGAAGESVLNSAPGQTPKYNIITRCRGYKCQGNIPEGDRSLTVFICCLSVHLSRDCWGPSAVLALLMPSVQLHEKEQNHLLWR